MSDGGKRKANCHSRPEWKLDSKSLFVLGEGATTLRDSAVPLQGLAVRWNASLYEPHSYSGWRFGHLINDGPESWGRNGFAFRLGSFDPGRLGF